MSKSTNSQKNIYLVHDTGEPSVELIDLLERQKFKITTDPIGPNIPALINSLAPDMVILDQMFPGTVTPQLCGEIRIEYHNPLVILTWDNREINHIQCLSHGADDFFSKPLNPPLFVAKIKALLRCVERFKDKEQHLSDLETWLLIQAGEP